MNDTAQNLLDRINNRSAEIGIIGMGYVGLPLALAFAERGFQVLGFDVDEAKVEALKRGESYIKHLNPDRVAKAVESDNLWATSDFTRIGDPDAILICVPTPLTPQREPDMTYVRRAAYQIREYLRRGQLIILESTTYPGTTDELIMPILEGSREDRAQGEPKTGTSGFTIGRDVFLAFSPEREDPGNATFGTTNTPKVVGGVDDVSGDLAQALYDQIMERTVRVSSARTAEATKLMENIFRSVNIALVNELKMIWDRMDIDVWEVLDAAATKPFGFMRFNPGPGLGGHCIPIDPFYLAWKAREHGVTTKFIEVAGEVNIRTPEYVIEKLVHALNDRRKPVRGSKVLVLGLAYKKDIDDPRESPSFEIIEALLHLGADVSYHDPLIPIAPSMRSWPDLPPMRSLDLDTDLGRFDAAVLVTDHTEVDYDRLAGKLDLIIDTRGVYRDSRPNVVKA